MTALSQLRQHDRTLLPPLATERIEIVDTAAGLAAMAAAWNLLWCRTGGLVFQSHAWVTAWWATAPDQSRRRLQIVSAWRGNDLVAVLPLAVCRRGVFRVLEWAAKDHTDYADAIVAPGCDEAVVRRMWNAVTAASGFDLAYLNRLLPRAHARTLLDHTPANGSRLKLNHRAEASLRVVGAWPNGRAWFNSQSKKTRQNYRRGQKSIEEQGALSFRLLGPEEPLKPILVHLAALKRQWLTSHQLVSPLFDEGSSALHALVQVLADLGVLRTFVLECDGKVVAISIKFVQNHAMIAFLTTYDPSFERASPGMVLMIDYIQWSFDHGIKTVDFLCGAESFKSRFATESVKLESLMGSRTASGALAVLADRSFRTIANIHERRAPALKI